MKKVIRNKEVVEILVRLLVRVALAALAGIGLGDVVGQDSIKQLLESFFTHLVTAIFILLSIYDLLRKPENIEKIKHVLGKGKFLFNKAYSAFVVTEPPQQ